MQEDQAFYGIDWNAPLTTDDDDANAVIVPPTVCPLSQSDFADLCQIVNPSIDLGDHGISQYLAVVNFTMSRLN